MLLGPPVSIYGCAGGCSCAKVILLMCVGDQETGTSGECDTNSIGHYAILTDAHSPCWSWIQNNAGQTLNWLTCIMFAQRDTVVQSTASHHYNTIRCCLGDWRLHLCVGLWWTGGGKSTHGRALRPMTGECSDWQTTYKSHLNHWR